VIHTVLLDIEGTTCPVSFVSQTLFPYSRQRLKATLAMGQHTPSIAAVIDEAMKEWANDSDPISQAMLSEAKKRSASAHDLEKYLQHLINTDRKSTALKELQGIIWEQGYKSGELKSPLFKDVGPQLKAWKQQNLTLAVYSSGSVHAQKLLYAHTAEGDLTGLFSAWFDTRTGPKLCHRSYESIATALTANADEVLFVSDHPGECDAAKQAGMQAVFCHRPDNPHQEPGEHPIARQLADIQSLDIMPSP